MLASQTQGQGQNQGQANPFSQTQYPAQYQGQANGAYFNQGVNQGINQGAHQGVAPQGFDFGSILSTVAQGAAQALPGLLMGLLSSDPQIQQQLAQQGGVNPQSLFNFGLKTPFGGAGLSMFGNTPQLGAQPQGTQAYAGQQNWAQQQGGVAPQGFDFGSIINTVAQGAAQALPGLLMGLLSANPQIQQQVAQQGGLSTLGNTPGVAAQGLDLGSIFRSVAQRAAQALPGLLTQLLSADPQVQQLAQQGGVNPQGLFNFGVNTPFGGAGLSMFGNTPQLGGQQIAQQWPGQQAQQNQQAGALAPQGFDIGHIFRSVAQRAAQALPGLLTQLLSADPQLQQIARQGSAGVAPQGLFNFGVNTPFGGAGLSIFENTPQVGGQQGAQQGAQQGIQQGAQQWSGQQGNQQQGAFAPQAIDLRGLAQNLANILAPQLPAIVGTILNQTLGSQQGSQVTVH